MSRTVQSPAKPYRRSSLYYKQAAAGATFAQDEQGWVRAERFSQPEAERKQTENAVGFADVSHVVKLSLKGNDLDRSLPKLFQGGDDSLGLGKVFTSQSGVLSNLLCGILTRDEALVVGNATAKAALTPDILGRFSITDITSVYTGICLAGPRARDVISKISEVNVNEEDFPNWRVTSAPLLHVQAIIMHADLGEISAYLLYFERAFGEYLWDAMMNAGREYQIQPLGSQALTLLGWKWS